MEENSPKTNMLTEDEFRQVIQAHVDACGSQTALAKEKRIPVQYLNDVLHGRRPISDSLAKLFGRKLVKLYVVSVDGQKAQAQS